MKLNECISLISWSHQLVSITPVGRRKIHIQYKLPEHTWELSSYKYILRKFHLHEYPACSKWNQYAEESHTYQKNSVKLWRRWTMRLIQYDEAQASHCKQETGGQTFHDILSVHTIRHKCYRSRVTMLICCRSYTRWFNNYIIYDSSCHQEVRQQYEGKDYHSARLHEPGRFL